jgi:hypothetical protein
MDENLSTRPYIFSSIVIEILHQFSTNEDNPLTRPYPKKKTSYIMITLPIIGKSRVYWVYDYVLFFIYFLNFQV